MSATTNLEIEKLNSADYVSVDPINNALDKLDKLGVDYVTESGTSGEWWYRKWKSGRAECGIDRKNFGTIEHKSAWGAMYSSGTKSWGSSYPVTFSSAPMATVSFLYNGSGSTHCSFVALESTNSTTTPPKFALIDPNSGTAENANFGIYVCGKTN
jgi:hypothetical protein